MNNPHLLLFLFTGIGLVIGMFAILLVTLRILKSSPKALSAVLFSGAVYFIPLMTKLLYAVILTLVSHQQAALIGRPIVIAGGLFGLVAITQGLLGATFMRPTVSQTRAESFSHLPMRLAIMGVIETVATMTMIFSIILSNANAQ